jgi:hypothetical protein
VRVLLPLLILLVAGGCGPLVFQSETKEEAARLKAMVLYEAAKVHASRSDSDELKELDDLIPYLAKGERDLLDPWGVKYQFKTVEVEEGHTRLVFWTTNPQTGKPLGWPRELAEE